MTERRGLGHVVLVVPDMAEGRRFYEETLGFRLSDVIDWTPAPEFSVRILFFHCTSSIGHPRPTGAIAQLGERRGGGDDVVAENCRERAHLPFRPQLWRRVSEQVSAAGKILGEVEGAERRPRKSERDQLAPAGLSRARPPSGGAPLKQLASE